MPTFDDELDSKFQAKSSYTSKTTRDIPQDLILDLDREDPEFIQEFNWVIDNDYIPHHDDSKENNRDGEVRIQDPYLNMKYVLQHGDKGDLRLAHVKWMAVGVEWRRVGIPSENPLLDSQQYKVKFLGGKTEIMNSNIIVVNLLAQVD